MFLSYAVYFKEKRGVEKISIPEEFIQLDMDDIIPVWMTGTLATLLKKVDPEEYEKCITFEKYTSVIYLILKK